VRIAWSWCGAVLFDDENMAVSRLPLDEDSDCVVISDRFHSINEQKITQEGADLFSIHPDAVVDRNASPGWILGFAPSPELKARRDEVLQQRIVSDLRKSAQALDRRIEHLLCSLDEARESQQIAHARLLEWVGQLLPELDPDADRTHVSEAVLQSKNLAEVATRLKLNSEPPDIQPSEWNAMNSFASNAETSNSSASFAEEALRLVTAERAPSMCVLIGPIITARMIVAARSLDRLARMSSGGIQLLGAERSFFKALETGGPPPKHGSIIWSHVWVHGSPLKARGRVARMLAGRLSIAARVDVFGGDTWDETHANDVGNAVLEIQKRAKGGQ